MKTGAADHHRILEAARAWQGSPMALATVVETWRSAPCPVGTHMLIHADGRFAGSVSGGCVEGDVLETGAAIIDGAPFAVRRYGVADGAAWEVGLPCGGDIVVIIQNVGPEGFAPALFEAIDLAQANHRTLMVSTNLETGHSRACESATAGEFINAYHPPKRLLIIGAVEIAISLTKIAQSLGIEVVVIDPRARFLTQERFPYCTRDDRWPDEAIRAHKPDARTAIVTLSHDIKIDDPALREALAGPAAYVAALGSKASHAARLERLGTAGADPAALQRIEGPAGVAINAISAPEIALSIAGGLVRAFNDGLR